MERRPMMKSWFSLFSKFFMLCPGLLMICMSSNSATAQEHPIQPALESDRTQVLPQSNATNGSRPAPRVRIGPGDLLAVTVFDVPELAQAVRVSDTGDATFTLIGRQHVAGLTTDDAQTLVARLLKDRNYIVDPHVSVLIQEYNTQGVSVVGEVRKPGVYPVLGNQGLLDVISQAGGTTEMAGSDIIVRRDGDEKKITMQFSTDNPGRIVEDLQLRPGDKIIVPRAGMVYVIGDVGRPGGFIMQTNGKMTLLQAVAMAAGTTPTSSLNSSRLVRRTTSGYTEIPLGLKKIMKGSEPDLQLEAEDIVVIPSSNTKRFVYQGVPGALQAAGMAAVYTIH
jgi:polysaccharide export outer membrane protein